MSVSTSTGEGVVFADEAQTRVLRRGVQGFSVCETPTMSQQNLEQCDLTPLRQNELDSTTSAPRLRQSSQCCMMIHPQDPLCVAKSHMHLQTLTSPAHNAVTRPIRHSSFSCSKCVLGVCDGPMARTVRPLLCIQPHSEAGPELSHVSRFPIMLTPWPRQRCPSH